MGRATAQAINNHIAMDDRIVNVRKIDNGFLLEYSIPEKEEEAGGNPNIGLLFVGRGSYKTIRVFCKDINDIAYNLKQIYAVEAH